MTLFTPTMRTSVEGPADAARPGPIVALQETRRGPRPPRSRRARVPSRLRQRTVHALYLAVPPGAVGPRVLAPDAHRPQQPVEVVRAVAGPVVRHYAPGLDAGGSAEAPGGGGRALAGTGALDGPPPPAGRDPRVRVPGQGAPLAAAFDKSQLGGVLPFRPVMCQQPVGIQHLA